MADGILCSICGTHLHEVKATRKKDGTLHRRRKCFNGHTFNTFELAVPEHGDLALAVFALERVIQSEQSRVDADRTAHPGDPYRGLMQLEDIELLKEALSFVRAVGQPEEAPDGAQRSDDA
jgi:hypothetical protein